MKTLDLSNIVEGVRRLGAVKETLLHVQEAYTETIQRMMLGLNLQDAQVTSLYGVVNSGSLPTYTISAGAVYYNGEVYETPAFSGVAGGGQVAVLTLQTTYASSDPALYSDNSAHNTHAIRKLVWSLGTSGSGIKDYSQVLRLSDRINTLLDVAGQVTTGVAAGVVVAKAYADSIVTGLWDDRGNYNASTNLFPGTGGSGTAGAILKGDIWTVSVIGTLGGVAVSLRDTVRALQDTPGQTAGNWAVGEANLGYTPENTANKDTDVALAANSDTKYASQKAVKTYIDSGLGGKQNSLGYTAENTANKDTDGTLAANSDTKYASQKAVKTYVDGKISGVTVQSPDAVQLYTKVLSIGDWNMQVSAAGSSPVSVAHGLTYTKIRSISVIIRDDGDFTYKHLSQSTTDAVLPSLQIEYDITNIILSVAIGSYFDNANFNATSFNRGFVTIIYQA